MQPTEPGCSQVHPSSAVVGTRFPLRFALDPLAALSPLPCLSPFPLSASHFELLYRPQISLQTGGGVDGQ